MLTSDDFNTAGMNVPTFYCTDTEIGRDTIAYAFCIPVVGVVFGGIHCVGWYFDFPSSAEALLWRVSSAVLTGIAFLLPPLFLLVGGNLDNLWLISAIFVIILQVYLVSRLLLLVEAFISLRHLTPGMLALVKWTSFIPHI